MQDQIVENRPRCGGALCFHNLFAGVGQVALARLRLVREALCLLCGKATPSRKNRSKCSQHSHSPRGPLRQPRGIGDTGGATSGRGRWRLSGASRLQG